MLFYVFWQDVFDLPFHMARDKIEESLRTKMASIKVWFTGSHHGTWCLFPLFSLFHSCTIRCSSWYISFFYFFIYSISFFLLQARMSQLQDAQKGAEVTCEATERELELEAQLVEARSIIQEQVKIYFQASYRCLDC